MARASVKKTEEPLPGVEEQARIMAGVQTFAMDSRFSALRSSLSTLCKAPPQSLLLEGGTVDERLSAAFYWSVLLNCDKEGAPCLNCSTCIQLVSNMHRDLFLFDGRESSIKISDVREMRAVLGEPPREAKKRLVIFSEAQAMGEEAANALLKSLEEPRPGTAFVLIAPQRERLLPTLVSRSWVLTLPWPHAGAKSRMESDDKGVEEWAQSLARFCQDGKGWMERTLRRGAADASLAMQLVIYCQRSLLSSISSPDEAGDKAGLHKIFSSLTPANCRILNEVLAECQDSINNTVNPALILDWLATRLFFICSKNRKGS